MKYQIIKKDKVKLIDKTVHDSLLGALKIATLKRTLPGVNRFKKAINIYKAAGLIVGSDVAIHPLLESKCVEPSTAPMLAWIFVSPNIHQRSIEP